MKNKVNSLDELIHLADVGEKVSCPSVTYFKKSVSADTMMQSSARCLVKMIRKGIYHNGGMAMPEANDYLELAKAKMLSTGMTKVEMADKIGISRVAIYKFFKSDNVGTKTLDGYLKALGIVIRHE